MAHRVRSGIPVSGTVAVHKNQALNWADDGFPSFHGAYDYDCLLTQGKQESSRFPSRLGNQEPTQQRDRPARHIPRPRETSNIAADSGRR